MIFGPHLRSDENKQVGNWAELPLGPEFPPVLTGPDGLC